MESVNNEDLLQSNTEALTQSQILQKALSYLNSKNKKVSLSVDEWLSTINIDSESLVRILEYFKDSEGDTSQSSVSSVSQSDSGKNVESNSDEINIDFVGKKRSVSENAESSQSKRCIPKRSLSEDSFQTTSSSSSSSLPTISSSSHASAASKYPSDLNRTENTLEILARVVDYYQDKRASTVNPTARPSFQTSPPPAISNNNYYDLLSCSLCKICGKVRRTHKCIGADLNIYPGPNTCAALKYLEWKVEGFNTGMLFKDDKLLISDKLLNSTTNQKANNSITLEAIKNLEDTLRAEMYHKVKSLQQNWQISANSSSKQNPYYL